MLEIKALNTFLDMVSFQKLLELNGLHGVT
jgi:hypothetical protein